MRLLPAIALVLALAAAARASDAEGPEREDAVTVHADGSGTWELHVVLSEAESERFLDGADTKEKRKELVTGLLHVTLGRARGIVAWTEPKCAIRSKRIELRATGWFEDANAVAVSAEGVTEKLAFAKDGETVRVSWQATRELGPFQAAVARAVEGSPEDLDALAVDLEELASMLHGTRSLALPGEAALKKGTAEASGSKVVARAAFGDVRKALARVSNEATAQRVRIANERVAKGEAALAAKKTLADVLAAWRTDLEVAARPKAGAPAELADFKAKLAEAKKSYAASGLEKKIDEARRRAADDGAGGD